MTRILIAYGTTDGQTGKIAEFLGSGLRDLGATVDVFDLASADPSPYGYNAVIVAASVHAGGYQKYVERWVRVHLPSLEGLPAAFLSVCLGVLEKNNPKTTAELARIRDRFVEHTGWKPPQFKMVAGALRYTRYGWFKRMAMRYMAGKAGGATDTSRDHEYTDWRNLQQFAAAFYSLLTYQPAREKRCQPACGCVTADIPD